MKLLSLFFLRHNGNTSLPLTFISTKERATKPSLLRASQEYTPLSSFTTSVIASLLFLSSNRVSIFALSGGECPSFFQVTFIVSSLTMQVNVRLSPAVSAGYWSGTTWAEAFPASRKKQLIKILVHIRHPHRQHQFSVSVTCSPLPWLSTALKRTENETSKWKRKSTRQVQTVSFYDEIACSRNIHVLHEFTYKNVKVEHKICNFLIAGDVLIISLVTGLASFTIWVFVSQNQIVRDQEPFSE